MLKIINNNLVRNVFETLHEFMFWWVTRAAILLLGVGVSHPHPHGPSFSCPS